MLFVYLIPPFTAALFVIRVICTFSWFRCCCSFFRLFSFPFASSHSLVLLRFKFNCTRLTHYRMLLSLILNVQKWKKEARRTQAQHFRTDKTVCKMTQASRLQPKSQRACFVPCHLHLVAIFDIFHGLPTTFRNYQSRDATRRCFPFS